MVEVIDSGTTTTTATSNNHFTRFRCSQSRLDPSMQNVAHIILAIHSFGRDKESVSRVGQKLVRVTGDGLFVGPRWHLSSGERVGLCVFA